MRIDKKDDKAYSKDALAKKYKDEMKPDEFEHYWEESCKDARKSLEETIGKTNVGPTMRKSIAMWFYETVHEHGTHRRGNTGEIYPNPNSEKVKYENPQLNQDARGVGIACTVSLPFC